MTMTRDEADRLIATIGAAYDRVATTMYALDSHPTLAYLRGATHTGRTKQMRDAVLLEVDVMWAQFSTVGDILNEARALRTQLKPADARWAELSRLLAGPVVALDAAGMPVTVTVSTGSIRSSGPLPTPLPSEAQFVTGAPGAPAPARVVGTVRVGDVAMSLQSRCLVAIRRLDEVGVAWAAATAAVAGVTDAMGTLTALARELDDDSGIAALDQRGAVLREQVLSDPMAHTANGVATPDIQRIVAELAADIANATARLRTEAGLRDSYPERIATLTGDIDMLADEEDEAAAAFARAIEKIAATGLPPVPDASTVLRGRIAELDALQAQKRWSRLVDDVATLREATARATQRARELRAAADGLIARRDELRGRLDGYRAKAARYRVDEHEMLEPLHAHARTLLYTAPCDLSAATKAVVAYQTTLAALLASGPSTGGGNAARGKDAPR